MYGHQPISGRVFLLSVVVIGLVCVGAFFWFLYQVLGELPWV